MNSVALVGRLTRDPDTRETAAGMALAVLRLAVPRQRDEHDAVFIDVVCFDRQALSVAVYLTKGRRVAVTGRLEQREWTAPDGRRRSAHEVVAHTVDFIDGPPPTAGVADPAASTAR